MSRWQRALPAARALAEPKFLDDTSGLRAWADLYAEAKGSSLRHSQAAILAKILTKDDVVGIAATGSGKSAAWMVPAAVRTCSCNYC